MDLATGEKILYLRVRNDATQDDNGLAFKYQMSLDLPEGVTASYDYETIGGVPPFAEPVVLGVEDFDLYKVTFSANPDELEQVEQRIVVTIKDSYVAYESRTPMDVLLFYGNIEALSYTGESVDRVDLPMGAYEYAPDNPTEPIGALETAPTADDGRIGGIAMSTIARTYVENTGRRLCLVPAAYSEDHGALVAAWEELGAWLETSEEYEPGRVMLFWNPPVGDESQNCADITAQAFASLEQTLPEIKDYFLACAGQSAPGQATLIGEGNQVLSGEEYSRPGTDTQPSRTLVSADATKYYWLNQMVADAAPGVLGAFAAKELGLEIGMNIVRQYKGRDIPVLPLEAEKGSYDFAGEFTGVEFTADGNKLNRFTDTSDPENPVHWAFCSAAYDSYAVMANPFGFAYDPTAPGGWSGGFDVTFTVRHDSVVGDPVTIFGSSAADNGSAITISGTHVIFTLSDGRQQIVLEHGGNPPDMEGQTYRLAMTPEDTMLRLYVEDMETAVAQFDISLLLSDSLPDNVSLDTIGKNKDRYLNGLLTELTIVR